MPKKVTKKKKRQPRKPTLIDSVIDRLGGNYEVACLLGVSEAAVSNYRAFGMFPAASYFVLRKAMKARGVQVKEGLWNMKRAA
jgi:hypothetical protein